MTVVVLPPLNLVQGQPTSVNITLQDDVNGPVDLSTGWSGELRLAYEIGQTPFFTAALTLDQFGGVTGEIDADTTQAIPIQPEIGGTIGGVFQIILTGPITELNEIWQGPFTIAGVI